MRERERESRRSSKTEREYSKKDYSSDIVNSSKLYSKQTH